MKFLLDTNVISELRKHKANANVLQWAERTPADEMATSVIILGEIRRGIELKRRADPDQALVLERWFHRMRAGFGARVLPIDEAVADAWALLSVPDRPPLIDGLLAATAHVHGLIVVTRNVADVARTGVKTFDPFVG